MTFPPLRHAFSALLLTVPLLLAAACGAERPSVTTTAADGTVALTIAEPVHGVGYLPLCVGIREGFFAEEGLDVSTVTLQGGRAHQRRAHRSGLGLHRRPRAQCLRCGPRR